MTKYRFNIYYTVGQEVIAEGNTPEEAKDNIRKGYFHEVGDDWDATGILEIDDIPNSSDTRGQAATQPDASAPATDAMERAIDILIQQSGTTSTPRITTASTGVLFTKARRLAARDEEEFED